MVLKVSNCTLALTCRDRTTQVLFGRQWAGQMDCWIEDATQQNSKLKDSSSQHREKIHLFEDAFFKYTPGVKGKDELERGVREDGREGKKGEMRE